MLARVMINITIPIIIIDMAIQETTIIAALRYQARKEKKKTTNKTRNPILTCRKKKTRKQVNKKTTKTKSNGIGPLVAPVSRSGMPHVTRGLRKTPVWGVSLRGDRTDGL